MSAAAARPVVVVNPRSGGGRTGRAFPGILPDIERALGPVEVAFTRHAGHGIDIARDAARSGRPLVVAVGGDGSLNEVANGVLAARADGAPDVPVGLVGQGTGGDFRRTLGIDHRLGAYLDAIASGRVRRIDAARLRYRDHRGRDAERLFVNIASAGMGGLVDRYVARAPAVIGGKAAYFAASAIALARCRSGRLRCRATLDGRTEERRCDAYVLAVCNGRYFGSSMHVAPMARPDDGVLDVVALGAPSKLAFAANARRIYDAAHVGRPSTVHFRCQRIEMDLENEDARGVFLLDVDGEPLGGLPASMEILPGALALRA